MEKIRFDNFIKLNRGFDLPDSQIKEGNYPVLASTSIKAYHNEYKVEGPMVTTGRSGSLGKVVYVEGKCWPLNTTLYVKDFKGNVPRYVYYYLQMMHLEQFNAGAGVPTLNQNHLHSLKIIIHSKDEQQKIASILSTYDTLIENNTKRIRLLEQMAENLYKEWFVRFRFPGHENVEMVNGLPKGWKIEKFGKYSSVKRGGSPRPIQDYISEKGLNWLKISDVTSFTSPFVFRIKECIKKEGLKKTVYRKAGTLVLSNSATPGISKILCIDTCIHDGWLYFEDSYFSNEYLFLFFKQERTNLLKLGNGAIFTNLKTDILKNYNMCIPSQDILSVFQTTIAPIFEQIKSLELQNQNLIRQRDLLLPRLMSGKLEVMVR